MSTFVDRVRVYRDAKGEYRWQALARNNEIVAASGEGYMKQSWASESAKLAFPKVRLLLDTPEVQQ
jgi:uncharacterized protein YegP (UPF0339 family)